MSQETINGIFYIALPEPTLVVIKKIGQVTGEEIGEVISNAIRHYALQNGVEDASSN